MSKREFNFPLSTLTRQAGRLKDALADTTYGPPVRARLPSTLGTAFDTLLTKVGGAPAAKAGQTATPAPLPRSRTTPCSRCSA